MSSLKKNYTLIIDKSGSMSSGSMTMAGKSLYEEAQEATLALARKIEKLDPDGIDLYFFSSKFTRYESVTSSKVAEVYDANDPMGTTRLDTVLEDAFTHANNRIAKEKSSEMVIIITDGEPDDRKAVAAGIVKQTQKMRSDEEMTILILQIGRDPSATKFLRALDDDLKSAGAKFDIVDVKTFEDMENSSIQQVLMDAIND